MTDLANTETVQYRVVQYVVNPYAGHSVPVAAVIHHPIDGVSVLVAAQMPVGACLGNARAHQHIVRLLPHLCAIESFDELPAFLGPHFVYAEPRCVSAGAHWTQWVKDAVFPFVEVQQCKDNVT